MNPNVKLTVLEKDQAIREWPVIGGFLAKAIPYAAGRWTLDDLRTQVEEGAMMCCVVWDPEEKHIYAVMGCEAEEYPGRRVFSISYCGGEENSIQEWGHIWEAFVGIARGMGFDQIEVVGRPGWKKICKGTVEYARCYAMDLSRKEDRDGQKEE